MKKNMFSLLLAVALFISTALGAIPVQQVATAAASFDLKSEIQRVVPAYATASKYDDWSAVADNIIGRQIPDSYIQKTKQNVIAVQGNYDKGTDIAKAIIGLTAAGVDVTNIDGINLIEKAANFNKTDLELSNDVVYMLLALDSGKYKLPDGAPITRQFLVDRLLQLKLAKGGWSFWGSEPDPDMTGIIMAGLAPYTNQQSVADAVYSGDKFFRNKAIDNSNSAAMLVVGLSATGRDATNALYNQDGKNAVDNLYSYLGPNGQYKWKKTQADGNPMSTKDVMFAYLSYQRYVDGKNNSFFYDLKARYNPTPEQPNPPQKATFDVPISVTSDKAWNGFPQNGSVTLKEGDTVDTALNKLVGTDQITYEFYKGMKYVAGIKGLLAGANGKKSGWTYTVNNESPPVGADQATLKAGDVVKWHYIVDQTPVTTPPGNGSGVTVPVTQKIKASVITEVSSPTLPMSNEQNYRSDMTAYDALVGVVSAGNVTIKGSGATLYVSCAAGLCERKNGPMSGWTYTVNGVTPDYSAGIYILKQGDAVVWKYIGTPPANNGSDSSNGGGSVGQPNTGNPTAPGTGTTGNESTNKDGNKGNNSGNGSNGGSSTTGNKGNGTNTGTNLTADAIAEHLSKYSDRDQISVWAKEAVARAKQLGILEGAKDKAGTVTFHPKKTITRAEFLTIVTKLLYKEVTVTSKAEFKDVKPGDWHYKYIVKAKEAGIIGGFPDGSFKPNEPLTREQVAIIVTKAFKLKAQQASTFKDVPSTHPSASYIAAVEEQQLMKGTNGQFQPKQAVTREMAAVIAVKLYDEYSSKK
ncbi:S-layer homology domain-containing protein [Paenibacillus sp. SC116]|uniref:S-layer homology domain-containing protein n=1 Tax=Paenibacillus sp. SC116 TaxID=2968986 RepID=UPI00215A7EC5|nr:S-layer homology domain-containing protein [Paenibacillus sp. SC116]MCR8843636.1 S-layer homology domain-containing protein [Paenibacillus sp. SC116]